jgi:hypothetical protein
MAFFDEDHRHCKQNPWILSTTYPSLQLVELSWAFTAVFAMCNVNNSMFVSWCILILVVDVAAF